MPRKHEFTLYTFNELSSKAKERAIRDFRDDPDLTWDESDSQWLTEMFEQDLADHYGLGDMKVGWGLSYTQGDGVCFSGSVNIESFIKAEKAEKRFERVIKLAQDGLIGAKIVHRGRDCHWNSMDTEVELYLKEEDLVPEDLLSKMREWQGERDKIDLEWMRARDRVRDMNMAPIREWTKQVERHSKPSDDPREWSPREPGPKPAPLNFPEPPKPEIIVPDWYKEAEVQQEREYKKVEAEVGEFKEYLEERIQDISREMEKTGYGEIEYQKTDEYIIEVLENRDWEYLKNGELWKG